MRRVDARAGERGAVLIISMVAVLIMSGLATALFAVIEYAQRENIKDEDYAVALEAAESGLERAVAALYRAKIVENTDYELAGLEPTSSDGPWVVYDYANGENPYKVTLRSHKHDGLIPVTQRDPFDIYEVSAVSAPVGRHDLVRGAQTVVWLKVPEIDKTGVIPGAMYVPKGHAIQLAGNYTIDGSDHVASTVVDDGIKLKTDAKLQNTYMASSAGYVSSFWVEQGGVATKLFDDSKAGGTIGMTTENVFNAGDELNFFIETTNTEDGTVYRHYAFGAGPDAMWYGTDPPKPYCRVVAEPDGITYTLFFEDLPGEDADWDYGTGDDMTTQECIASTGGDGPDQVVQVVILPEGTTTTGSSTSWDLARFAGIPAVGHDGPYSDLGVSVDDTHILTITEDGTNVDGIDAYANASIPVADYAAEFKLNADQILTSLGDGNNLADIGTMTSDYKVTYLDGNAGTLAGTREGAGILVVNGDLHISGKFQFEGLVVVLGNLQVTGGGNNGMSVLGAVLAAGDVQITGNADILYSSQAVDKALKAAGMTLEDLAKLIKPTEVEPPEHKVWRELDAVQAQFIHDL